MITITWHIIKSSSLPSSHYYRWKLGLSMNLRTFPILFIPFQIFMFFFFNVTVAAALCLLFALFFQWECVCVSLSLSPVNVWKILSICVYVSVCLPAWLPALERISNYTTNDNYHNNGTMVCVCDDNVRLAFY